MAALYHSLFTEKGLELLRESIQNGTKLGITHMSFGDGGGDLPIPDASFTQMISEVYRVQLNRLAPSRDNPNWLEADGVIPSAVGGFNIREVGLWAGNTMVAYANYPPTYKPSGDQGTAQIKTIRIVLQIDNTANFELKIDASVVMATIQSVEEAKQVAINEAKRRVLQVECIDDLLLLDEMENGDTAYVKSYKKPNYALAKPFSGGHGTLVFDESRISENDSVTVFNGWVRQIRNNKISVHDAGAVGDYDENSFTGTDDSTAIQNAIKAIGQFENTQYGNKSIQVTFDADKNYFVKNAFLTTERVTLEGNGCTLYGDARINDCIRSGYFNNGVLTDLTNANLETAHLFKSQIKNFNFKNFNNSINIRGLTFGCRIQDCISYQCNTHIKSVEHYFLSIIRNRAAFCNTGYSLDLYSGMTHFFNVSSVNCNIGYEFNRGAQALRIQGVSAENCTKGVTFLGSNAETGGIFFAGCYFENISDIVVDCAGIGLIAASITMENTFVNCPNAIVFNTTGSNVQVNCDINKNYLRAYKTLISKTDTQTLDLSNTELTIHRYTGGSAAPNSPNGVNNDKNIYPSNDPAGRAWGIHRQIILQYSSVTGTAQAKHIDYRKGLIPANYYGNQGTPNTNTIPFCSHIGIDKSETVNGTTTPFLGIDITTSINVTDYMTGLFNLVIYHNSGIKTLVAGRFYGMNIVIDVAKTAGVPNSAISVSASIVNNILVLNLAKLTGGYTPGSYTCTGFIKLI